MDKLKENIVLNINYHNVRIYVYKRVLVCTHAEAHIDNKMKFKTKKL